MYIALRISNEKVPESGMVCQGCDSWGRELKTGIVFAFFKEEDMSLAIVKATDQDDIRTKSSDGYLCCKLLIVETSPHRFHIICDF